MSEETKLESDPAEADGIAGLLRRVHEHKMVQWTIAYVALAYGIQHAVVLTTESLEWPQIVERVTMIALALGVPIAVTLAWYHGAKASRRVSGPELSIIAILLVTASMVFYAFVRPPSETAPRVGVREASVTAARRAASDPHGAISLAVLPFVNLSPEKDQEFFSDGMTEEITAALAKIPDLRVVARTSAFEFKGKNVDIRTMGEQLGATHLIEGSVRKAGDRLRITVQLIKSDDGTHIWAEDYDRQLTDVFAVQEEIARTIAASLRMPLGLKPGENLVNNRDIDTAAYQQYLRAVALLSLREPGGFEEAAALLEHVVAAYPAYAPAWAALAADYYLSGNRLAGSDDGSVAELRPKLTALREKGEAAARKAIQLDANRADAYVSLGTLTWSRGVPIEADAYFKKALELDPSNESGLFAFSIRLAIAGHLNEAVDMIEKARSLDPLLPQVALDSALILWVGGHDSAAMALASTLRPLDRPRAMSAILASQGRYNEAADSLSSLTKGDFSARAQLSAPILRSAPAKAENPETLPNLWPYGFVYLYVGAPERALDDNQRRVELNYFGATPLAFVWQRDYAPVRMSQRFKDYARRAGLINYWRALGWPDLCRPVGQDDFACD